MIIIRKFLYFIYVIFCITLLSSCSLDGIAEESTIMLSTSKTQVPSFTEAHYNSNTVVTSHEGFYTMGEVALTDVQETTALVKTTKPPTVDTYLSKTTDKNVNDFVFYEEDWYYSYELEQMPLSKSSELLQIKLYVSDQSDLNVLEKFPNIKELSLTIFSDISVHSLASLPNLEKIYIYGEHASWYSLSNVDVLAELPFLQHIYIGNMDVNLDLSVFESLGQLKFLSVQGVRSVSFSSNSGFSSLDKLSIAETSCDLNNIPVFPHLKDLSIIYCNISDEKNIENLNCCTSLERLSLRGSLKEYAPEFINIKNLSELDICFEADYTVDKVLIHKSLKKLTIREGMFSDMDLKIISENLTECEINSYLTY